MILMATELNLQVIVEFENTEWLYKKLCLLPIITRIDANYLQSQEEITPITDNYKKWQLLLSITRSDACYWQSQEEVMSITDNHKKKNYIFTGLPESNWKHNLHLVARMVSLPAGDKVFDFTLGQKKDWTVRTTHPKLYTTNNILGK